MATVLLPLRPAGRLWRWAQFAGVVLTLVLIAALVTRPEQALHVLWDMVIPLLPAVFLVNPMLWRNVCPLATLNTVAGERASARPLELKLTRRAWVAGMILLFLLVPARRFLFNTNGIVLAITIGVVATLAVIAGLMYARRAGFCNALCPVLPVEKLYGQAPLLEVGNPRCSSCAVCTPIGCIDLAERKTIAQTIGPMRRDRAWIGTTFGIFALTFPGFVIGYFTLENGSLGSAPSVYGHVILYMVISYAVFAGITDIWNLSSARMLPILGGIAFMLYYWFSAPNISAAYELGRLGAPAIRIATAGLLAFWTYRSVLGRAPSLRWGQTP